MSLGNNFHADPNRSDRGPNANPPQSAPPIARSAPWTPGATIARCNGLLHDGAYLVASNFVVGQTAVGCSPAAVVPYAIEDTYLSRLSEAVLGPREHALSIPSIPGHQQYLRAMGMLLPSNTIIELPYNPLDRDAVGYPAAEIFSLAKKRGLEDFQGGCVVSWFPSPAVEATVKDLGCFTPQTSNSYFTNNKVYLREKAAEYGIQMCDGLVVRERDDLALAETRFANAKRVWIKNDIGSGGDGVVLLEAPITKERLERAIEKQFNLAKEAFRVNQFDSYDLASYWGSNDPKLPPRAPARIVIEADASVHGEVIANCSNLILVKNDGSFSVERYFRQRVTAEGAYQGSQPFVELDPPTRADLDRAMEPLVKFCAAHGLFGIVGVDFMLVRLPDGIIEARIIELNGRPPVSASAAMAAEKLGAQAWINCNMWGPHELHTMDDFERMMTFAGVNHARTSLQEGLVFPLAFRALYSLSADGSKELFHPSQSARILICGESIEHCEALLAQLIDEKKISLSPPKE